MNVFVHMKSNRQRIRVDHTCFELKVVHLMWPLAILFTRSKEGHYQHQQMQCHTLELDSSAFRACEAWLQVAQLGDLLQSQCKAIRSRLSAVQFRRWHSGVNLLLPDIPTCGKWSTAFASLHVSVHNREIWFTESEKYKWQYLKKYILLHVRPMNSNFWKMMGTTFASNRWVYTTAYNGHQLECWMHSRSECIFGILGAEWKAN